MGKLNAFEFARETIPHSAIVNLHERLISYGSPFRLEQNQTYALSPNHEELALLLVTVGIYAVCHVEDDLHMGTGFSPSIVGLIDAYSLNYNIETRPQHYICAETACEGYLVKMPIFLECADKFHLWHDISRILAHRLMVMSARESELVGVNSYTKVRALLLELWAYPENYRQQINVESFIERRSGLSRSHIMRVLSELKKGEYVKIIKGKLIWLANLPKLY